MVEVATAVGGGAVACTIGLLSARAAMVAGAADMGGKDIFSCGWRTSFDMAAVVLFSCLERADIMAVADGSEVVTGGRVILSDASLIPDEFMDM